jgi:hypothetical protein
MTEPAQRAPAIIAEALKRRACVGGLLYAPRIR